MNPTLFQEAASAFYILSFFAFLCLGTWASIAVIEFIAGWVQKVHEIRQVVHIAERKEL